jgi:hypothetical protein
MRYVVALFAVAAFAATPADPVLWSAESLKQLDQNLASKLIDKKLAAELDFGPLRYKVGLAHE